MRFRKTQSTKASRMTNPHEILQEESNEDGTTITPPDDDLDLLCSAIAEKVAELEVARISLKDFPFPNEGMRSAFAHITERIAHEVYKLCLRLKALLPPPVPPSDPPHPRCLLRIHLIFQILPPLWAPHPDAAAPPPRCPMDLPRLHRAYRPWSPRSGTKTSAFLPTSPTLKRFSARLTSLYRSTLTQKTQNSSTHA
jgi:hypothetical protein